MALPTMRIALLSTCTVAVPPKAYGGTELVAAELAKHLTLRGHDVTVYATGDSSPAGRLRFRFSDAIWPPDHHAELRHAAFSFCDIASHDPPFDVIHAHQAPALAFSKLANVPVVHTIHHHRDESLLAFYRDFPAVHYVAISQRQAELIPELSIAGVIHHGIDASLYPPGRGDGGYVAFLGRLAEEKGPHIAIRVARRAGLPIRLGGRPHMADGPYYEGEVLPLVDPARGVTALGELAHIPKVELLRHAAALLFPIAWEEPFGLVMIESMLVGTPVIGFARGSVAEVIDEGVTGFVVRDEEEMARRVHDARALDRARCRARARERFSSERMTQDYQSVYEHAVRHHARSGRTPSRVVRVAEPMLGTASVAAGDDAREVRVKGNVA